MGCVYASRVFSLVLVLVADGRGEVLCVQIFFLVETCVACDFFELSPFSCGLVLPKFPLRELRKGYGTLNTAM